MLKRSVATMSVLRFEVAGGNIETKNMNLFEKHPRGGLKYYDGVLGMDALAASFTLDYRAMRLVANSTEPAR